MSTWLPKDLRRGVVLVWLAKYERGGYVCDVSDVFSVLASSPVAPSPPLPLRLW